MATDEFYAWGNPAMDQHPIQRWGGGGGGGAGRDIPRRLILQTSASAHISQNVCRERKIACI